MFKEKTFADNNLKLIANRPIKATTEEVMLRRIEIEKEVESIIEQHIREKQKLAEKVDDLEDENENLKTIGGIRALVKERRITPLPIILQF